jgi:hypothetical protein
LVNNEATARNETTHLLFQEPVINDKTEERSEVTVDSTIEHETKPLHMRKYFPFLSPYISFICIQMCLLVQSFYLAMLVIHYAYVIVIEDGLTDNIAIRWIVLSCCFVPVICVCFIFIPLTLPDFTILYSIENLTNKKILKQKKEEEKTVTPLH